MRKQLLRVACVSTCVSTCREEIDEVEVALVSAESRLRPSSTWSTILIDDSSFQKGDHLTDYDAELDAWQQRNGEATRYAKNRTSSGASNTQKWCNFVPASRITFKKFLCDDISVDSSIDSSGWWSHSRASKEVKKTMVTKMVGKLSSLRSTVIETEKNNHSKGPIGYGDDWEKTIQWSFAEPNCNDDSFSTAASESTANDYESDSIAIVETTSTPPPVVNSDATETGPPTRRKSALRDASTATSSLHTECKKVVRWDISNDIFNDSDDSSHHQRRRRSEATEWRWKKVRLDV